MKSLLFLPSLVASPEIKTKFVRSSLLPLVVALASGGRSLFGRCAAARLLPPLLTFAERAHSAEGDKSAFSKKPCGDLDEEGAAAGAGRCPGPDEEKKEAAVSPERVKHEALQL